MEHVTEEQFEQFTVERPWGNFTVLNERPDHKVKRLLVKPGCRLSLQRHRHRREHWLVVSGVARITRNGELIILQAGGSIDIGMGDIHRIQNDGEVDVVLIEIQLGDYFGEDDIERLENDYGRVGEGGYRP